MLLSWLPFNIVLDILPSSLRQEKELKDIRCWSGRKKKVTYRKLHNCLIKAKIIHKKLLGMDRECTVCMGMLRITNE